MTSNNIKGIVFLDTQTQFDTLSTTGTLVIGTETLNYDPTHYIYSVKENNFISDSVLGGFTQNINLSDGGTITDITTLNLMQHHLPISINGYLGQFSNDDGTNYHYYNLTYDSVSNVNHLNIITINKTTWVATFHTSNLNLS